MSSDHADEFIYTPLNLEEPSIRLDDVLPRQEYGYGYWHGTIECRIKHVVLRSQSSFDDIKYAVLSYEWGDPTLPLKGIEINGKHFAIRQNLFDFLDSHLERNGKYEVSNLWIDALCIDQANIDERNHQVQQMRDIYRGAEEVLVWLGPSGNGSDEAFDFLNSIAEPVRVELSKGTLGRKIYWLAYAEDIVPAQESLEALESLARRLYWTRLWIIQEILLARRIRLLCGLKEAPWVVWAKNTINSLSKSNVSSTSPAYEISKLWLQSGEGKTDVWLGDIVVKFGTSQCENLHDKVYGLMALATKGNDVRVDYNQPIELLLLDVIAKGFPERTGNQIFALGHAFECSLKDMVESMSATCGLEVGRHNELMNRNPWGSHYMSLASIPAPFRWCPLVKKQVSPLQWISGAGMLTTVKKCCCHTCYGNSYGTYLGLNEISDTDTMYEIIPRKAASFYRRINFTQQPRRLCYLATIVMQVSGIPLIFYNSLFNDGLWFNSQDSLTLYQALNLLTHEASDYLWRLVDEDGSMKAYKGPPDVKFVGSSQSKLSSKARKMNRGDPIA